MKRVILVFLSIVFLMGGVGQAQQPKSTTQEVQELLPQLPESQLRELERAARQLVQARGAGQRSPDRPEEIRIAPIIVDAARRVVRLETGAWWTNTALVARLGITDEQKAKVERAFENHRLKLASTTELLEKEEAQLSRLLQAEPIDRNAILTQIDRVVQARGEMERANSAMTLEMREALTAAQWNQLPQNQNAWNAGLSINTRGAGGRGAPAIQTPVQPGQPGQRQGARRGQQ